MQIPHFWKKASAPVMDHKGRQFYIARWGWSDTSFEEAFQKARELAQSTAEKLTRRGRLSGSHSYGYGDRPLREEIIQEYSSSDGSDPLAVVTRNAQGCLVLNTPFVAFIDVDLPKPPSSTGLFGLMRRLFGRKQSPDIEPPEVTAQNRLTEWLAESSDRGVRVYRTPGGLRYLVTHEPLNPEEEETYTMMNALGGDPLYIRLCRSHRCYRARLSPKPWRLGLRKPQGRYPRKEKEENKFKQWLSKYESAIKGHAACQFVSQMGNEAIHPEISQWVEVHDEMSGAHSGLPLA